MTRLTKEQAAIIGAYTGFVLGPFSDVHQYAEMKLGRPIWTHEFADDEVIAKIKEAAKPDFIAVCYVECNQ